MLSFRFQFLFVIGIVSVLSTHAQNTVYIDDAHHQTVIKSIKANQSVEYAICGIDSSQIVKIHKRRTVTISDGAKFPKNVHFSSLLCIKQNVILAGTSNSYLYCFRNSRFEQLNRLHGLTDSCILSIDFDKDNKMILITTKSARFILTSNQNRFILKKIQGAIATNTQSSTRVSLFKKYFRRPIQRAICNTVSDIDLSGRKRKYISNHDQNVIKKQLKPGDILLKHNDNQLINIGIPGIWSHSAIYIGGEKEINEYFKNVEMLGDIKPFDYIKYHYPQLKAKLNNRKHLIIEAIGEGVVINPLSHCTSVDCFVALRTKLSPQALFQSLLIAFDNYGKPYDFLFDIKTDDALVCSELIYKSFMEYPEKPGLQFKLGNLAGVPFISPNDIAKQFCEEQNTVNSAFNLVVFYNCNSKLKKAFSQDSVQFCKRTLE